MSDEIEMQPLEKFRLDGGTQARLKIEDDVVMEYAEAMQRGDTFPPVIAFDDGNRLWLADGFHRYSACKLIGKSAIATDRRNGTQRDAILYSLGANASHGLRRSNADKRRAVETMLKDTQWSQWSSREIARRCGVDEKTVRLFRDAQPAEIPQAGDNSRKYVDPRSGREITMNTANIGENNGDSGKSRKIKKRLAGIRAGLCENVETASREILGVKGGDYCRALVGSLGRMMKTAEGREVDSDATADCTSGC
ncbi:MAG TPA: hypothetical protein PKK48_00155 [Phycisphaerae bacterium]|nr:hypothetical protein [Phycisphaerae bacterium]